MGKIRSLRQFAPVDAAAICAFAVIGLLSHRGTVGAGGLAEDALPLLAGWFCAAVAFGAYRRGGARLVATWLVGIPLGVALRAVVLDRDIAPTFLVVTLVFVGAWVLAARLVARATGSLRRG
jgi:hypothetical protein